jgi:tetratricopeptide (TPR) repeat protein
MPGHSSLLALVAMVTITAVLQQSSSVDDTSGLVEKIQSSLVIVLAYTDGSISQGSGFFIDRDGAIITSLHVINSSKKSVIKTEDGRVYPIKKVLSRDISSDLACILPDIPKGSVRPIPLSPADPSVGDPVIVGGCPLGVGIIISKGIISGFATIPGYGRTVLTDASISNGSSGGPIINMNGEAVGVVTFSSTKGQNLNFAIPCGRVERVIVGLNRTPGSVDNLTSTEEIYLKGLTLIREGEYSSALPYFEETISSNHRLTDAYVYAGYCDNELGKYEAAIGLFDVVLRMDPTNADAWNDKGYSLLNIGSYNESINCSEEAIVLDPNFSEAWNNKGAALYNMSRFIGALECFNRSLQINPHFVKAWNNKGKSLVSLGRYNESLKDFGEAIDADPKFAIAWNNEGFALYKLGRYNESIDCYNMATEINPQYALAWNNKGNAFRAMGMYNDSRTCFIKAIDIDPSYARPWKI